MIEALRFIGDMYRGVLVSTNWICSDRGDRWCMYSGCNWGDDKIFHDENMANKTEYMVALGEMLFTTGTLKSKHEQVTQF